MNENVLKKENENVFEINHYYYLLDRCSTGIGKYIPVRFLERDEISLKFMNLLDNTEFEIDLNQQHLHKRLYFSEKLLEHLRFEKLGIYYTEYLSEKICFDLFQDDEYLILIFNGDAKGKKIIFEKRLINSCDYFDWKYSFKIIIGLGEKLIWVEDLFKVFLGSNFFKKTDNFVKELELDF